MDVNGGSLSLSSLFLSSLLPSSSCERLLLVRGSSQSDTDPDCPRDSAFPESPRWLALKGRNEEALQTLARLHAHGNVEDPLVAFELEDIKAEIKASNPENVNP